MRIIIENKDETERLRICLVSFDKRQEKFDRPLVVKGKSLLGYKGCWLIKFPPTPFLFLNTNYFKCQIDFFLFQMTKSISRPLWVIVLFCIAFPRCLIISTLTRYVKTFHPLSHVLAIVNELFSYLYLYENICSRSGKTNRYSQSRLHKYLNYISLCLFPLV